MWKESNMKNAFGRRMARDMPRMPALMRNLLLFAEGMGSVKYRLSSFCMMIVLGLILKILSESYLGFGNQLINENDYFVYMNAVVLFIVFYWVGLGIINFVVNHWYYSTRKSFR
ncbi:MAG: hypothetical protein ACI9T7_000151 [Oleiphilaceae bacterium]|jgi:hypothetical protein